MLAESKNHICGFINGRRGFRYSVFEEKVLASRKKH